MNYMTLPTINTIARDDDGTFMLQSDQYECLCDEASIHAAESGADREYNFDLEEHTLNWISTHLGTDSWYVLDKEPEDN